jgi:hypothetical protein
MKSPEASKIGLPIGLKIAAIYLIISGTIGMILPFTGLGPHHLEFEVKNFAYKLGAYSRAFLFDIVFVISGIGILFKKYWARKSALIIIVLNAIYTTNEFAWGFAKGKPSLLIYLLSFAVIGTWSAVWFFIIFKRSSAEAINRIN